MDSLVKIVVFCLSAALSTNPETKADKALYVSQYDSQIA